VDEDHQHSAKYHSGNMLRIGLLEQGATYEFNKLFSAFASSDYSARKHRMAQFTRGISGHQVESTPSGLLSANTKQTKQSTMDCSIGEEISRNNVANVGPSEHGEQRKRNSDLIN
jgi:hypothetical protein